MANLLDLIREAYPECQTATTWGRALLRSLTPAERKALRERFKNDPEALAMVEADFAKADAEDAAFAAEG